MQIGKYLRGTGYYPSLTDNIWKAKIFCTMESIRTYITNLRYNSGGDIKDKVKMARYEVLKLMEPLSVNEGTIEDFYPSKKRVD